MYTVKGKLNCRGLFQTQAESFFFFNLFMYYKNVQGCKEGGTHLLTACSLSCLPVSHVSGISCPHLNTDYTLILFTCFVSLLRFATTLTSFYLCVSNTYAYIHTHIHTYVHVMYV